MAKGIAKSRPANSMKLLALACLAMAAVACVTPGTEIRAAVAPARFLACIQAVEQTPGNPYGLTREVWEQHMAEPYLSTPAAQVICAQAHLRTLKAQLRGRLVHAEVWELAVCWLRGFDGGMAVILRDTPDPIADDYGWRVSNLYCDKTFDPLSIPTLQLFRLHEWSNDGHTVSS